MREKASLLLLATAALAAVLNCCVVHPVEPTTIESQTAIGTKSSHDPVEPDHDGAAENSPTDVHSADEPSYSSAPEEEGVETPLDEHEAHLKTYMEVAGLGSSEFVDDLTYETLLSAYSGIDFYGEFETGDVGVYSYYLEQYCRLLNCEASFRKRFSEREYKVNEYGEMDYSYTLLGIPQMIKDLEYSYDYTPANYMYYYFDFDGDGNPELCVSNEVRFIYIFKYLPETDEFILWYEIPPSWILLLGSRKTWQYSGTSPAEYQFVQLDESCEEELNVWFMMSWYSTKDELGKCDYFVTMPYSLPIDPVRYDEWLYENTVTSSEYRRVGQYLRVTEEQFYTLNSDFDESRHASGEALEAVRYTYEELLSAFLDICVPD